MAHLDIIAHRLYNQRLSQPAFAEPGEVVKWLGAVQAQEFAGAKWTLGMRMQQASDAVIERAFTDGDILRTHLMRPTWHFVLPSDIRWMLMLTAPRVHAANAYYYRKFELDDATFARSNAALANALQGGKHLPRSELNAVLERAGIVSSGLRFGYLLMRAELDMVLCSGPRRGNQFTYALLDERAPSALVLERDEALAMLTRRYFTSHGPATLQDYSWWSGLTMSETNMGIELVKSDLLHEVIHGKTYWFSASLLERKSVEHRACLLQPYDEYTIAYKDRSAFLDPLYAEHMENGSFIFDSSVVLDGHIVASWKRTVRQNTVLVEVAPLRPLDPAETEAIITAIERYSRFIGKSVSDISWL